MWSVFALTSVRLPFGISLYEGEENTSQGAACLHAVATIYEVLGHRGQQLFVDMLILLSESRW